MTQVTDQVDFGQDTIRFYFAPGCLEIIRQVTDKFYAKLEPLGDGRYKAAPMNMSGHFLEVDIDNGFVVFHYDSSNGRDNAENVLASVRQDLSKRLEVIPD